MCQKNRPRQLGLFRLGPCSARHASQRLALNYHNAMTRYQKILTAVYALTYTAALIVIYLDLFKWRP